MSKTKAARKGKNKSQSQTEEPQVESTVIDTVAEAGVVAQPPEPEPTKPQPKLEWTIIPDREDSDSPSALRWIWTVSGGEYTVVRNIPTGSAEPYFAAYAKSHIQGALGMRNSLRGAVAICEGHYVKNMTPEEREAFTTNKEAMIETAAKEGLDTLPPKPVTTRAQVPPPSGEKMEKIKQVLDLMTSLEVTIDDLKKPAKGTPAAAKPVTTTGKTRQPREKGSTRPDGLKQVQVKLLETLAALPEGAGLNRATLKAKTNGADISGNVGCWDAADRAVSEEKMGYPSLLTLGMIEGKSLDIDGKTERRYHITAKGREALLVK